MRPRKPPPAGDASREVAALIANLRKTGQRLEELTSAEVDSVLDGEGRTLLLRGVQQQLIDVEAVRQAAILNALPAHIAQLDSDGVIVSVNDAWRRFSGLNRLQGPGCAVGLNYLEICDGIRGEGSSEAHQAAEGIRSVLRGGSKSFSIEYPCHSSSERCWFQMTVTPVSGDPPSGAVVAHLDITARMESTENMRRFRAAMDISADAIVLLDRASMCYLDVNQTFCDRLGYKREEVIGRTPMELFGVDRQVLERDYDALIADDGSALHQVVSHFRHKDGSLTPTETRRRALHTNEGWIIAAIARDITERREADNRIAYLNRVYAVLSGINTLIVRARDRDELFRDACRVAVEAGGFRMAWISIVDPGTKKFVPVASVGVDEELLTAISNGFASGDEETMGSPMSALALRQRKAAVANDTLSDPRVMFGKKYAERGMRSMAVLPLMAGNEAVGVFVLNAGEAEFFHPEEMKLLTELAGDISFAIDHIAREAKRKEAEARVLRLNRVYAVLSGINTLIVRASDREELFREACRIAVEQGNFKMVSVGVIDREAMEVRPVAWAGASAEGYLAAVKPRFSLRDDAAEGLGTTAQAVRDKKPVVMNFAEHDSRLLRREAIVEHGIHSLAILPLVVSDEAVGVFVLYAGAPGFFDDDEMKMLTELAGDISFAIDHIASEAARKEAEAKVLRLNRVYAVLSGINTLIVRARDRDELFRESCRIAVEHGKFIIASISVVDQEAMEVRPVAWAGASEEQYLAAVKPRLSLRENTTEGRGRTAQAIRQKKPVVINDTARDPQFLRRKEIAGHGISSVAILPLLVSNEVVGIVALFAAEAGFFDDEEMKLLTELAGDISFALEQIEKDEKLDALAAEKSRADEALQRQQTELRALFDLVPAMIWFKDTQNGILRVNSRVAEAAGKTVLEIEGKPSAEIYPLDAEKFYADDLEVMRSGVPKLGYVEPLRGTDGRDMWVQTDKVPYFGQDGKVIGIVVMAQDITQRKRAEHDLQRFRQAMDSSGDAIFLIDRASLRYIDVNQTLCDLFGYSRQEIVGRTPMEIFGAERAVLERDYDAIIADTTGRAFVAEGDYAHRNGSLVPNETRRRAFRVDGEWVIVGSARDITERRRAEESLRKSEAEFRSLAEAMPQIVWATRPDGWTVYFNHQWMDYTGLTLEDSLGHGWNKPFHPDDRQRAWGAWQRATSEIGAYSLECRLRRSDGTYRWWLIRGVPIKDAQGAVLKWFGTCTDIHDLKTAELEIATSNQALLESSSRIRRLNRVYAVLSGINTLVVRVRDRDELFKGACRIALEEGGFLLSAIWTIDSNTMNLVPTASSGDYANYAEAIHARTSLADGAPAGYGPLAMAARQKQAVIVNDVAHSPLVARKDKHAERGTRSMVCLPLLIAGEPVGVLSLHAAEVGYFVQEEMKLLEELAGDIAYAIDNLDKKERLDYLAYYDLLTGLANRGLFVDRVAQHMRGAEAGGHGLGVFLIDLERFKNINDSLGQPAGDAILRQTAERLSLDAGGASYVARMGADQFAVVMPMVKPDGDLARLIEKWAANFVERPFHLNDAFVRIAIKLGAALYPEDGADAGTLLRNAEAALKKAKATGERYLFYTQNMNEAVAVKLSLENQLRQALDKNEFVLHYQPKLRLAGSKLTGAEALIRWNDPRVGLVPPGRFIPVLEETGLINEVGRWALRKAIEDYLRWRNAGLPAVRIAVNVSPLQLRHRGFVAEIEQVIGVDPHAAEGLELEITESLIMQDVKHSIASLAAIRAMGVSVAIDDFGTGFSSLSYLARLPVDTLKIDRSFVIDMTRGPQGLALVSTIIGLAHSLSLKVVAEGVETEEQSRLLHLLGCDEMQGFLFSKPVPADIFEAKFLAPPAAG
jgi:diguanylate cyclase (GGDEF)-like protein/PAS domain S-box-containing protein